MENAEIKPQMAQIECHPRAQRTDARQLYADNYDIQVECWYPLNHNRLDVNFVDYEYDHTFTPTSVNENNETNTDTGETRIYWQLAFRVAENERTISHSIRKK